MMKILIADDHELFLQGLEFILQKQYPEAQIVLASNYNDIFKILKEQKDFDLILTDLAMPGANWLDALKQIHTDCPDVPIIIISAVFDRQILQKTFDIGVSGYVSKSFSNSLIISAINLVMAGGIYVPPEVLQMSVQSSPEPMRELLASLNEQNSDITDNNILTPRQKEVLACLAEGLSNKQIAYRLGVSEGTIKIHITLLLRALEVTNRLAAVRKAVQLGIIKEEK
ncbi:MAG: response regulator transcription factor [Alphaproteobacteria bacterium]|nr:response regulator transcription factor [Alphaproteobacteria bacterium]